MSLPFNPEMFDQIIHEIMSQGWTRQLDVLGADDLKAINAFFDEHRGSFVAAKVGKGTKRQRMEEIRGDYTYWLDLQNPPAEFQKVLFFLEEVKIQLNRKLLLGIKEYEGHLAYYPPGSFYKKHLDKFEQDSSRVFSFIFYLNSEWTADSGGELVLYNKAGEVLHALSPEPGSFVGFLSEELPHEVRPSQSERRSLTGWMHTRIIY